MRRAICLLLVLIMCAPLALPAFAAPEGPVITLQPQSPNYPNYSVAIYTVKVEGTNLSATWYMEWQGRTYEISAIGGSMQAWEPYAGEAYGARKLDDNTFAFIFEGIERDLDGAYIWCVIEDGHYAVYSQRARVSVGNPYTPPEIISIPPELTVQQGEEAEIRCVAKAPNDTQLSFVWYETDTGRMEDMYAVNRGTETSDYMFCDTSRLGTRTYLCCVTTSEGGLTYTSMVHVTVTEKENIPEPPSIQTNVLPDAEEGKAYSFKLSCTDPDAHFSVYYSPGGKNELEGIGLKLDKDGTISGTPKKSGSISFSVCAANMGGEDYMTYELAVRAAPTEPTQAPTEAPTTEAPTTEAPTAAPTTQPEKPAPTTTVPAADPTTPATTEPKGESDGGIPWWAMILVGVAAAGIGVGVAVVLIKKK